MSKQKLKINEDLLSGNERIEKALALVEKHIESTKLIIDDYMAGSTEMCDEIEVINDRLKDAVEELKVEEDFNYVIKQLEKLEDDGEDIDYEKLLDIVVKEDEELFVEHLEKQGFFYVKLETMIHKEKILDFIKAEIYTSYNDQRDHILFNK